MVILEHGHKFFDTPPTEKSSLCPLPLDAGRLMSTLINGLWWKYLLRQGHERHTASCLLSGTLDAGALSYLVRSQTAQSSAQGLSHPSPTSKHVEPLANFIALTPPQPSTSLLL